MAPMFSRSRHIPHFRRSPDAPLPNYKALVIGINYTWSPDGSGPGDPDFKLKGPVNDAMAIKKTLKEVYHYREQDIFFMTDTEDNKGTEKWPSAQNILRAIDNLVRGASARDMFVFYYAGHCGRQLSTNNGVEEENTYIVACDLDNIFDNTFRKRLVDPLPMGSRLVAIMDACYSGTLLALNHYRCHYFLRQRSQSVSVRTASRKKALRRHTEAPGHLFLAHSTAYLRRRFSSVVTTTLAIIRLKSRLARRSKAKKCEKEQEQEPPRSPTPTPSPSPLPVGRCSRCNRDHDLSDAPDVISLSPCTEEQQTWEDSTRKGKGMTVKLIKILKKNPSINLDDLNKQMNKCLSKLSFKRVRKTKVIFRRLGELVTPRRREELEKEYKDQGILDFNEQTAHFGSLRPLRLDDRFILERDWT